MEWLQFVNDRMDSVVSPPAVLAGLRPPKTINEFIDLVERPETDPLELDEAISRAPELTAGILRLANARAFTSIPKAALVTSAVKRLGAKRLRMAVMSTALQATLKGLHGEQFDGEVVLAESHRRAVFARLTAKVLGVDADYAYIAGMLQDLLLPFLRLKYPHEYADIAASGESIATGERERFGWDHGLVTAELLKAWEFPDEVIVCVACHHDAEALLAGCSAPCSILTAALAAGMLPDTFQQEPEGIKYLLQIQESLPEFDLLRIAGETDDALECEVLPAALSKPLSETLNDLVLSSSGIGSGQYWTGQIVGRYQVEEVLGHGTMGLVHRARHLLLHRPAAIKFMCGQNYDANAVTRFEREAKATSKLQNSHTVHVLDHGATEEGVLYYVMEYLEGITLRDLVEQHGPQPESRVIHILCQACAALGEAHAKGLIHRDIKPDNILLSDSGGVCDFVKVTDFGLVHSLHGGRPESEGKCIVGTPHYMSPEAIMRPAAIDHRTDIYALGAVGYFLLTGEPVFPLPTTPKVLRAQINATPESPNIRLGRPIAYDLEEVILACLEKSPSQRPLDAGTLAEMLLRCKHAGHWTSDTAREWWREHLYAEVPV